MPDGDCVLGAENRTRINNLDADQHEQWSAIEKLRDKLDRLPAWASLTMTGLGAVAGAAVSAAIALAVK